MQPGSSETPETGFTFPYSARALKVFSDFSHKANGLPAVKVKRLTNGVIFCGSVDKKPVREYNGIS